MPELYEPEPDAVRSCSADGKGFDRRFTCGGVHRHGGNVTNHCACHMPTQQRANSKRKRIESPAHPDLARIDDQRVGQFTANGDEDPLGAQISKGQMAARTASKNPKVLGKCHAAERFSLAGGNADLDRKENPSFPSYKEIEVEHVPIRRTPSTPARFRQAWPTSAYRAKDPALRRPEMEWWQGKRSTASKSCGH